MVRVFAKTNRLTVKWVIYNFDLLWKIRNKSLLEKEKERKKNLYKNKKYQLRNIV